MAQVQFHGTGRRKESVARVRLVAGDGRIVINGRSIDDYFGLETLKAIVRQPLVLTDTQVVMMYWSMFMAAASQDKPEPFVTELPGPC